MVYCVKIVILNDYAWVQGGAAQVAVESAHALAEEGFNVSYVYGVGPVDPRLVHDNIKLFCLGLYDLLGDPSRLRAAINGLWNYRAARSLRKILLDYKREEVIVHVHSWVKSLSPSIFYVLDKMGLNYVTTLHDYFTVCPNGGFFNYKTCAPCGKKALSLSCFLLNCDSRRYSHKLWRFFRTSIPVWLGLFRGRKNYIYVSDFSKNILKKVLSTESSFWYVRNPIETEKNIKVSPSKNTKICYVGRISKEKGAILFAEAAASSGLDSMFVGAGDAIPLINDIIDCVDITGWASKYDVFSYIKKARLVVFPSLLYETQGLVVYEAASLGVPCVVSDSCAAAEFIEDGVNGLLFSSNDIDSLVEKLKSLEYDDELVDMLGSNAYQTFWKSPPLADKHAQDLLNCYMDIISMSEVH